LFIINYEIDLFKVIMLLFLHVLSESAVRTYLAVS